MNRPREATSKTNTAARLRAVASQVAPTIAGLAMFLAPHLAWAETDGGTEVTIRRLEEPVVASPLAQTGVGGQAWLMVAAGLSLVAIAVLCLAISRRRHGSH